jgi:hypothetical protein
MNEADRSAWCRTHGVYPEELAKWRASATTALAAPEEMRVRISANVTDDFGNVTGSSGRC